MYVLIVILGDGIVKEQLPNNHILDYKIVNTKVKAELMAKNANCVSVYAHQSFYQTDFSPETAVKLSFYSSVDELIKKIANNGQVEVKVEKEKEQPIPSVIQEVPRHSENDFEQVTDSIQNTNRQSVSTPVTNIFSETDNTPTFIPTPQEEVAYVPPAVEPKPVQQPMYSEPVQPTVRVTPTVAPQPVQPAFEQPVYTPPVYTPPAPTSTNTPSVEDTRQQVGVQIADIEQFSVDNLFESVLGSTESLLNASSRGFEKEIGLVDLADIKLVVRNTLLDSLIQKANMIQQELVSLRESKRAYERNLTLKQEEINKLSREVKEKISTLSETYSTKLKELKELSTTRLNEANETIRTLQSEKIKLAEEVTANPVRIYGTTPKAITLTNKKYSKYPNVSFLCKGAGVSASNYYSEVQNMINTKPAVYLDLTCNAILTTLNGLKAPTTSFMVAEGNKLDGVRVSNSILYPSESVQDLTLYSYPLDKVLQILASGYKGAEIVIILESIESTATKTVVSDLSKSSIKGVLVVEEKISLFMTYQELPFFDTTNVTLYVPNATEALKEVASKTSSVIQVKLFKGRIDWTQKQLT